MGALQTEVVWFWTLLHLAMFSEKSIIVAAAQRQQLALDQICKGSLQFPVVLYSFHFSLTAASSTSVHLIHSLGSLQIFSESHFYFNFYFQAVLVNHVTPVEKRVCYKITE